MNRNAATNGHGMGGRQHDTSGTRAHAKQLPSAASETTPGGRNHAHMQPCRTPAISAPYLDQLQQNAAHESVRIKPYSHLYAQFAFVRLARRHNPALGSFVTLHSHSKRVVGPLYDSLRVWRRSRARTASELLDGGKGSNARCFEVSEAR